MKTTFIHFIHRGFSVGGLFLLTLFSSFPSLANHVVCTEMRYTCTATPGVYLVGLKLYRDCSGVEFCSNCPTSLNTDCKVPVDIKGFDSAYLDVAYGSADLTIVKSASAFDVLQLCNLNKSICSNCGTRTPGTFTPGIEIYYFEGLVNLSAVPAGCCKVRIGFNQCCRGTSVTTILNPVSTNYYTDVMINRCVSPCNSSPIFANDPVFLVCTGQEVTHDMGAIDPDGDSLTYEKSSALQGRGSPVSYANPYSGLVPFPYLGAPVQSPPALPPLGIYIDPTIGEVKYKPMGSFVANMPLVVKQWKYINGKAELVGEVTRDISIQSVTCAANNPPIFKTYDSSGVLTTPQPNYTASIPFGKTFCMILSAWDNGASTDTTDLKLMLPQELINSGASITRLYDTLNRAGSGPKYDSLRFCWTPNFGQVRNEPYYIRLRASDRACPVNGITLRSFSIKVNGITSIQEQPEKEFAFSVYPNPASDQLTIELTKASKEKLLVELIAIDGRQVLSQSIPANQSSLTIKLGDIPAGAYFVRLNGSNFQLAKKVLVKE